MRDGGRVLSLADATCPNAARWVTGTRWSSAWCNVAPGISKQHVADCLALPPTLSEAGAPKIHAKVRASVPPEWIGVELKHLRAWNAKVKSRKAASDWRRAKLSRRQHNHVACTSCSASTGRCSESVAEAGKISSNPVAAQRVVAIVSLEQVIATRHPPPGCWSSLFEPNHPVIPLCFRLSWTVARVYPKSLYVEVALHQDRTCRTLLFDHERHATMNALRSSR